MHSPLEQFKIEKIFDLNILNYDISFTNSSLMMLIVTLFVGLILVLPTLSPKSIPGNFQAFSELIYEFVDNILSENTNKKGANYLPLIFTSFIFVLFANFLGLFPYSFTVTSHIAVTFALALVIFIVINIVGVCKHGFHFFSLFLPEGTPLWLAPLMIIIEIVTYLSRPFSLSIRLAANMIAGHVLLKILASFVVILGVKLGWIPLPFLVIFTVFEFFVALLQAYIFSILACVYLNDALNLH